VEDMEGLRCVWIKNIDSSNKCIYFNDARLCSIFQAQEVCVSVIINDTKCAWIKAESNKTLWITQESSKESYVVFSIVFSIFIITIVIILVVVIIRIKTQRKELKNDVFESTELGRNIEEATEGL
jgi:hypothetical protein